MLNKVKGIGEDLSKLVFTLSMPSLLDRQSKFDFAWEGFIFFLIKKNIEVNIINKLVKNHLAWFVWQKKYINGGKYIEYVTEIFNPKNH